MKAASSERSSTLSGDFRIYVDFKILILRFRALPFDCEAYFYLFFVDCDRHWLPFFIFIAINVLVSKIYFRCRLIFLDSDFYFWFRFIILVAEIYFLLCSMLLIHFAAISFLYVGPEVNVAGYAGFGIMNIRQTAVSGLP